METYTWTTEKGARVKMMVATQTDKETVADGAETRETTIKVIKNLTVNGQAYEAQFGKIKGKDAAMFRVGARQAAVILPEDIKEAIWEGKTAAFKARLMGEIKADEEYRDHYNRVMEAMKE